MGTRAALISALVAMALHAQDSVDPQTWNLYVQATSIGQYHPAFPAAYTGPFSLSSHAEAEASLTTTIFLGLRLTRDTQLYFDPEVAGGRGFSGTDGVANFPNGEIPRVATATPKPYLARLYLAQDFGFGDAREAVAGDENQLGGTRPMTRYSIYAGRFTATDFFDNNRYSHDPRTQFMGWAVMYNGAWDYPADTHGYTWGIVQEFHTRSWSLRYGMFGEPRYANGIQFDRRVFRDHGSAVEGEVHFRPGGHDGAVRLMSYFNRTQSGNYAAALKLAEQTGTQPNVAATRQVGTLKYGFGISADQEIRKDIGVFCRLGWNDGKTESFAFTAMDRLASGGISVTGTRWKRPEDTLGAELAAGGLAGVHALYLERGGNDFLIGDGTLRYAPELIFETYYSARLVKWLFAGVDLQHINNPAYNQDRGPVWVASLRLHIEKGTTP